MIRPYAEYSVSAIPRQDDCRDCQVVASINGLYPDEEKLYRAVWAAIYDEIPIVGLPRTNGWKELPHGIRQLQFGGLPGPGFRILWFEGETAKEIVCSYAFVKRLGQSTPREAVERARFDRKRSQRAVRAGRIEREMMRPEDL